MEVAKQIAREALDGDIGDAPGSPRNAWRISPERKAPYHSHGSGASKECTGIMGAAEVRVWKDMVEDLQGELSEPQKELFTLPLTLSLTLFLALR